MFFRSSLFYFKGAASISVGKIITHVRSGSMLVSSAACNCLW